MLLVPLVWDAPPNTSPQVPDVVGSVDQFPALDQLPLPALPDQVVIGAAITEATDEIGDTSLPVRKTTASSVDRSELSLDRLRCVRYFWNKFNGALVFAGEIRLSRVFHGRGHISALASKHSSPLEGLRENGRRVKYFVQGRRAGKMFVPGVAPIG